jgi:hypothetical protein
MLLNASLLYLISHNEIVGEVRTAYTIEYVMIKDNRLYVFDFTTDPLQVPTFLPITQKMIDSFQIIK